MFSPRIYKIAVRTKDFNGSSQIVCGKSSDTFASIIEKATKSSMRYDAYLLAGQFNFVSTFNTTVIKIDPEFIIDQYQISELIPILILEETGKSELHRREKLYNYNTMDPIIIQRLNEFDTEAISYTFRFFDSGYLSSCFEKIPIDNFCLFGFQTNTKSSIGFYFSNLCFFIDDSPVFFANISSIVYFMYENNVCYIIFKKGHGLCSISFMSNQSIELRINDMICQHVTKCYSGRVFFGEIMDTYKLLQVFNEKNLKYSHFIQNDILHFSELFSPHLISDGYHFVFESNRFKFKRLSIETDTSYTTKQVSIQKGIVFCGIYQTNGSYFNLYGHNNDNLIFKYQWCDDGDVSIIQKALPQHLGDLILDIKVLNKQVLVMMNKGCVIYDEDLIPIINYDGHSIRHSYLVAVSGNGKCLALASEWNTIYFYSLSNLSHYINDFFFIPLMKICHMSISQDERWTVITTPYLIYLVDCLIGNQNIFFDPVNCLKPEFSLFTIPFGIIDELNRTMYLPSSQYSLQLSQSVLTGIDEWEYLISSILNRLLLWRFPKGNPKKREFKYSQPLPSNIISFQVYIEFDRRYVFCICHEHFVVLNNSLFEFF